MSRIRSLSLALLAVFAAVGCGTSSTPTTQTAQSTTRFNVLISADVSGAVAGTGVACTNGIQAAALVINREGGILGHKVSITTLDSAGSPTTAVSTVTQALSRGTTWNFAAAGTTSDQALALSPTLNNAKLINMSTGSATQLNAPTTFSYHFGIGVVTDTVAKILVDNVVKLGYKKVGLLTEDVAFSQGEMVSISQYLKAASVNFIPLQFSATAVDVSPTLLQLQAAGVDAVVWSALGTSAAYVAKSRAKVGFNVPFVGDIGVAAVDLYTLAGADNIKGMSSLGWAINTYVPPAQQTAAFKTFHDALQEVAVTISLPLNSYASCWDEMQTIKIAAQQANSLDPDKLKTTLESLKYPSNSPLVIATGGWGWSATNHFPVNTPGQFVISPIGPLQQGQIHPAA